MIEDVIGAGRGALGADIRPAVARIDDAQPRERKIAHRARGHADVLAELRLDQDHNGSGQRDAWFGLVGARTGHLTSPFDSTSEDSDSSSEQPDSTSHRRHPIRSPVRQKFSSTIIGLVTCSKFSSKPRPGLRQPPLSRIRLSDTVSITTKPKPKPGSTAPRLR